MGDAFYRWDGFSYYASFSEFLPSLALAFLLWSIVAAFVAFLWWAVFRLLSVMSMIPGFVIKLEHALFCTGLFFILGVFVWMAKKLLWPNTETTFLVKSVVFVVVALCSAFVTFVLRKRAGRWEKEVQVRITPLVWLFGVFFVLSLPLVSYNAWFKKNKESPPKVVVETSPANKPNIILVTFDALAAGNMSAYGYERDTTPFIRRWMEKATLFKRDEAASNFTTPSAASLMTGKRVWTHQTFHIEGTLPRKGKSESLPSELKKHGYYNIALVVNPFASIRILGMNDSFDIAPLASEFSSSASLFGWKFGIVDKILYRAFGERIRFHNWIFSNEFILSKFLNLISRNIIETTVPPEKAFDRFMDIIDNNVPRPFFAWIHLFPPHDPYLPPEPYRGYFSPSSEFRSYKEQERLIEESYKYLFQARRYPEAMGPSVQVMRDHYDEYVKYIDNTFNDFIGTLNERRLSNTVILLSADHGESFDHGYFTHGGPFLYEQVSHVPLIIKEPGQTRGQVIRGRVEQIDTAATILDLANISVPPWMEGRSLVPLMRGGTLPLRPAFSMNFQENRSRGHQITRGTIAVWEGDYKLIYYLDSKKSILFNLKEDPEEVNNLIDKEPDIEKRLLALINENLEKVNEKIRESKKIN